MGKRIRKYKYYGLAIIAVVAHGFLIPWMVSYKSDLIVVLGLVIMVVLDITIINTVINNKFNNK